MLQTSDEPAEEIKAVTDYLLIQQALHYGIIKSN